MINKIYKFIQKFNMLSDCSNIVLGLSGGADSVCLLKVLKQIIDERGLGITITCIHVNHGIRGEEALRDQEFSRKLCEKLGVRFIVVNEDVVKLAKDKGLTVEEAGRLVRYKAFEDCASKVHNARIAVAHHMNDEAETVLMNIFRGSSVKGASGMRPVRDNIIRPLLCVTRAEIEEFLLKENQDYVTDSTNNDTDYTRNKLRNELIPYIKSNFNNNIERNIFDMASDFADVCEFVEGSSALLWKKYVREEDVKVSEKVLAIEKLEEFSHENIVLQRQVIAKVLKTLSFSQKDIYRKHIEIVLDAYKMQVGKSVNLPYGICCHKSYDKLIFEVEKRENNKSVTGDGYKAYGCDKTALGDNMCDCDKTIYGYKVCGKEITDDYNAVHLDDIDVYLEKCGEYTALLDCLIFGDGGSLVRAESITFEIIKNKENLSDNIYTKYFDYDKMERNLCVRFKENGDYLTINKNGQTKALGKELLDKKVPGKLRGLCLLLTSGNLVLWTVAVRRGENAYVDDETSRILKVSVMTADKNYCDT